jgi:hypothetical protein
MPIPEFRVPRVDSVEDARRALEELTARTNQIIRELNAGVGGGGSGPHAADHAAGGSDEVTLAQSQITGLAAALAGKEAAGTSAAGIAAHVAAADPHAQYALDSALTAAIAAHEAAADPHPLYAQEINTYTKAEVDALVGGGGGGTLEQWPCIETLGTSAGYVDLPASSIAASFNDFTIELWMRPRAHASFGGFISFGTGGDEFLLYLDTTGKVIVYTKGSATTGTQNIGIQLLQWSHLAVRRTGTSLEVYINGVLTHTGVASAGAYNIAGTLRRLLGDGGSEMFQGAVSDIRIWNVARTATQIGDNYDVRLTGSETGLIGYWKCDEASGSLVDSSASAAHGTLSGQVRRIKHSGLVLSP